MQVSKYDRQIRLWGAKGQFLLAQSKVALVGCSGTGIEALKNLVLPGVGQVDIWDPTTVQVPDLSESFFYERESVGKSKAKEALRNLLEMNPEVKGEAFEQPPLTILDDVVQLKQYSLIICSHLKKSERDIIVEQCSRQSIAAVTVQTIGVCFWVKLYKNMHFVQTQKSFAEKYYLRLGNPFQLLINYSNQWNIQQLVNNISSQKQEKCKHQLYKTLSQIPYPIILLQAKQQTKEATRQSVRNTLLQWQTAIQKYLQNFSQASKRLFTLFQTPHSYLDSIQIVSASILQSLTGQSPKMLIFLKAYHQYYSLHSTLPQPSALPDISTTTQNYISLKRVYKEQHCITVKELLLLINRNGQDLSFEEVSEFVENITALKVMRLGSTARQYCSSVGNVMLAVEGYEEFVQHYHRHPRVGDGREMVDFCHRGKAKYGVEEVDERYALEFCRVGGSSTIGTHSMAGAVVAQQCIKLLTHAFTPAKVGFVFDGYTNEGYEL